MSVSDNETPSFPPMIAPVPTIAPEHPNSLLPPVLPSMEPLTGETNAHLAVSDPLSRKRCASALEEHRTVKAPKREPQDDVMSPLTIQEPIQPAPGFTLSHPNTFPVVATPLVGGSQSRPPSRPPTPPSAFVRKNSFGVSKQQPLTSTFPPFLPGGSVPSSAPLPLGTSVVPPGFPHLPHSSWSDPVVPTRHHHSLSAGAIPGPITSLPSSPTSIIPNANFVPSILPAPLTQSALTISKPVSSIISPPIGRMSRSGSISGTNFRHVYAPYSVKEPYADPSATWHVGKASNSPTRNGQSSWYMGAESSNTQKKFSFAGNSAPSSTKNSPRDDDDDDDDSESEESDSGKTVTYQPVRNISQPCLLSFVYILTVFRRSSHHFNGHRPASRIPIRRRQDIL